jgi:hypothetical protein
MPTKSTYYINAPNFLDATSVFTDPSMSTCAPDGFYSIGGVVREQVSCVLLPPTQCPDCEFICEWDTTLTSSGSSTSTQAKLPLVGTGQYNFSVEWGDGRSDLITAWNDPKVTHTYDTAGTYVIRIKGVIKGWQFIGSGDRLKITEIYQWGCFNHFNQFGAFQGCSNLQLINVVDTYNVGQNTILRGFFDGCSALTIVNKLNEWDVSGVQNFYVMFRGCTLFNTNINDWDVTGATTYGGLNIAEGLHGIFRDCATFNQPLNNWDVSGARTLNSMFWGATVFNQDISMWDTGQVRDFQAMFRQTVAFNQPIGGWDTSNALSFEEMFSFATAFNQPIETWTTGSVTNFRAMFFFAPAFNQPLGGWDMTAVNMGPFLSLGLKDFMNGKTEFNYSPANFDATLIGWAGQALPNNITADFGSIKYTTAGQAAAFSIAANYLWTINSGLLI